MGAPRSSVSRSDDHLGKGKRSKRMKRGIVSNLCCERKKTIKREGFKKKRLSFGVCSRFVPWTD
jgi:hypothetical protein